MFSNLEKVITGAAAIVAIIPGASLVGSFVELPIQFDSFMGLLASVVGPIVFFVIYLCKDVITGWPNKILIAIIVVSTIAGIGSAYWLNEYSNSRIASFPYYDLDGKLHEPRYLIPEKMGSELTKKVEGRNQGLLINAIKRDREGTFALLRKDARPVRRKLMIGFLATQALFILSFLMAAWAIIGQRPTEIASAE